MMTEESKDNSKNYLQRIYELVKIHLLVYFIRGYSGGMLPLEETELPENYNNEQEQQNTTQNTSDNDPNKVPTLGYGGVQLCLW